MKLKTIYENMDDQNVADRAMIIDIPEGLIPYKTSDDEYEIGDMVVPHFVAVGTHKGFMVDVSPCMFVYVYKWPNLLERSKKEVIVTSWLGGGDTFKIPANSPSVIRNIQYGLVPPPRPLENNDEVIITVPCRIIAKFELTPESEEAMDAGANQVEYVDENNKSIIMQY